MAHCANGHPVGEGMSACPVCGALVSVERAPDTAAATRADLVARYADAGGDETDRSGRVKPSASSASIRTADALGGVRPPEPHRPASTAPSTLATSRQSGRAWKGAAMAVAAVVLVGIGIGIASAVHRSPTAPSTGAATQGPGSSSGGPTASGSAPATSAPLASGLQPVDTSQVADDPLMQQVAITFETYFGGIDQQDFAQAYGAYSPAYQSAVSLPQFQASDATSSDSNVSISAITQSGDGSITVDVEFTSHQDPADGPGGDQPCTDWSLAYQLVPSDGSAALSYLIDSSQNIGSSPQACQ